MDRSNLIPAAKFCSHHQVEVTFIQRLQEYELVQVVLIEEEPYLPAEELPEVEKLMRLHYDLNINMEGLDAVRRLLRRTEALQREIQSLRNQLDALR
jgi:hypothetical protein